MTRSQVVTELDKADKAASKRQRSKMRAAAVRSRLSDIVGGDELADAILFEFAVTHKADLNTQAGKKDRRGWLDLAKSREAKAKSDDEEAAEAA